MYNIDFDRLIKDANIKKSDLAARLGVSNATITKVVQGKMAMPESWINKIKITLKIDPNDYKITPLKTIYEVSEGKPLAVYEDAEVYGTANPVLSDHITMKPNAFVTIPMFSSGDAAIQVKGHSMKGYINHGDWIVVKKITNKEAIIYGEPYLVITKSDNLKTVKFVKQGDTPGTLWLCQYNIEQFEPQEIEKNEVLEMYSVVGLFRSL